MTPTQASKIRSLVRKCCCNFNQGNCLLLDNGYEPCLCPQLITRSLICKWFREAVLPDDMQTHDEIILRQNAKICTECGARFIPGSNRARYCPDCAQRVRRAKEAKRQRERFLSLKAKETEELYSEN